MKTLLFIIVLSSCVCVNAQIKVAEPEFSGNIIFVNDSAGSGIKLEQQTASVSAKANGAAYVPVVGFFAGKSTVKNFVQGASSPIQIDKNPKVHFIVKVSDNAVDPITVINIFRLNTEKDKRTVELASAKIVSGAKTGDIKFLTFSGTKYGQSSYLIEIDNIESGEYAITLATRRDIFNMFGVK